MFACGYCCVLLFCALRVCAIYTIHVHNEFKHAQPNSYDTWVSKMLKTIQANAHALKIGKFTYCKIQCSRNTNIRLISGVLILFWGMGVQMMSVAFVFNVHVCVVVGFYCMRYIVGYISY